MLAEEMKKNIDSIINEIKEIVPELTFPEIQGYGLALKNVTKIDIEPDEKEFMFTAQNIVDALEKVAEDARNEKDDSYMQLILSLHALGTIHIYNDFLMFSANMMLGDDEDSDAEAADEGVDDAASEDEEQQA